MTERAFTKDGFRDHLNGCCCNRIYRVNTSVYQIEFTNIFEVDNPLYRVPW